MSNGNTDTGDTLNGLQTTFDGSAAAVPLPLPALPPLPPREALITTAINFLQNEKIHNCGIQQKQKFLRSKGLTAEEIQIACERAGAFTGDPNSTVINMGISTGGQMMGQYQQMQTGTFFTRLREILNSFVLAGGVVYAVYVFYKRYIENYLFGKKKKKTVEESIEELDQKVDSHIRDLSQELAQIKETVISSSHNDDITRELHSFKSDLDSIKGLLLNRKQFANPIQSTPPHIPAWQLTSSHHRGDDHSEGDKNDDAGSGSGSSETEVVTKNSDSSLEIM